MNTQVRVSFDWLFEATLNPRKDQLIAELRPQVVQHVNDMFKECWLHLHAGEPDTQSTTRTDIVDYSKCGETIHAFFAIIVNRDLPPGASVFLAPTMRMAKMMLNAWNETAATRLGAKPV